LLPGLPDAGPAPSMLASIKTLQEPLIFLMSGGVALILFLVVASGITATLGF